MAKITIVFGVLLMALGATVFFVAGRDEPSFLIPVFFGFVLLLSGLISLNPRKRQVWMPLAVVTALIGFIFPLGRGLQALYVAHAAQEEVVQPLGVMEELLMAALCFVFTVMCVRSFRKGSKNEAA